MFGDIDKFPTFDELHETNATFRLFTDLLNQGEPIDLGELWRAAGRPWLSPRRWLNRFRKRYENGEVVERGNHILGDQDAALHYLQLIDASVAMACYAQFARRLREDPARHMLGCPNPIMALFAKATLADGGMGEDEANQYLTSEAVKRTGDLDPYAQETRVAEVQRAVEGLRIDEVCRD
jgi:hypothetical protein